MSEHNESDSKRDLEIKEFELEGTPRKQDFNNSGIADYSVLEKPTGRSFIKQPSSFIKQPTNISNMKSIINPNDQTAVI